MRLLPIVIFSVILFSCQNKPNKIEPLIKPDIQRINAQKQFSKLDFLYLSNKIADSVRKAWSLSIEDITFYVSPNDTIIQVNDGRLFYQNRYFRARITVDVSSYERYSKIFIDIYADTSISNVAMLADEMRITQENQESLDFRARTIQLHHFLFVLELNKDFSWSDSFLSRIEILLQRLFINYLYRKYDIFG